MADDRYHWLDEDAAERLLRGEPAGSPAGTGAAELTALLNAAAAAGRDTAGDTPLPGEEAAVAAFRQVRDGAGTRPRASARTRFGRPLRRGFMVALAGCALGGVAVAAGAGVLPTPFRSGTGPNPATSVSAAETPGPPASDGTGTTDEGASRMPDATPGTDRPDPLATDAGSDGKTGSTPPPGPGRSTPGGDATGGGDTDASGGKTGDDPKEKPDAKERHRIGVTFCRTYESGKRSVLGQDTLRRLERAAGGSDKIHAFCRQYLSQGGGNYEDGRDDGGRGHHGQGGGPGRGHSGKGHDDGRGHAPPVSAPGAPGAYRAPAAPLVARV